MPAQLEQNRNGRNAKTRPNPDRSPLSISARCNDAADGVTTGQQDAAMVCVVL
jgi:hypothetical protein